MRAAEPWVRSRHCLYTLRVLGACLLAGAPTLLPLCGLGKLQKREELSTSRGEARFALGPLIIPHKLSFTRLYFRPHFTKPPPLPNHPPPPPQT